MPHNSSLSFWEKGMTSDMGTTFLIGECAGWIRGNCLRMQNAKCRSDSIPSFLPGHHQLGNSREMAWESTSQHLGSARHVFLHAFIMRFRDFIWMQAPKFCLVCTVPARGQGETVGLLLNHLLDWFNREVNRAERARTILWIPFEQEI